MQWVYLAGIVLALWIVVNVAIVLAMARMSSPRGEPPAL